MKRILFLAVAAAVAAVSCIKGPSELSVSPDEVLVPVDGGIEKISLKCDGPWSVSKSPNASWCSLNMAIGTGSATLSLTVESNVGGEERTAAFTFTAEGLSPVVLNVVQAGGESELTGTVSPEKSSGITFEPEVPDADAACTIKFNPQSGNPLYGYAGDIYAHLGVVVEGEWQFVPCDWGTTDEKCHFTKVADNSWELRLEPTVREFFGSGTTPVTMLAIVVRNEDGSLKSHASDQFCTVTDGLYKNSFEPDPVVVETMPVGVKHGINYNADGSVTFVLYEKDRSGNRYDYCYIVGDWNGWTRNGEGAMKRDEEAGCWWITLDGFDPDKEYRFQYRLGTPTGVDVYVSDPFTEIVYDQWNDQYISWAPEFPSGAKAYVSAFRINRPEYEWKYTYDIEDRNDLVIYEMLFRDYTSGHDIAGAMEELDHIDNLGVNAVEIMPIHEFEGNLSWGYNPNHWFALDKYYGTREEYKQFIDECHGRGMAVIVDVVYNHAYGSHSWARMYWDAGKNSPSSAAPWFNIPATHPYNVGFDLNHENAMVKDYIKQSLRYLMEEYHVDGFRFDLTKGFTQTNSGTGEDGATLGKWSRKDESRIRILKDYADFIWSVDEDAVVIFEHLSDWDEEQILAEHGIQLWRKLTDGYRAAVAGNAGDFTNAYSVAPFGGYVGYMESHDEERICYGEAIDFSSVTWGVIGIGEDWANDREMTPDGDFLVAKNIAAKAGDKFKIRKKGVWDDNYNLGAASEGQQMAVGQGFAMINGSSSKDMVIRDAGTYDIWFCPDLQTVWVVNQGDRPEGVTLPEKEDAHVVKMRRAAASAAFFLTVPGPKMIWQFGEFGYDISIEYNGRTGEKPVKTAEYMADPERFRLYETYRKLIEFRTTYPRFFDSDADFVWNPTAEVKTITCSADGMTFHVVGNFGKTAVDAALPEGVWKDWFGQGAEVSGTVALKQGEFRLLLK